MNNGYPDNWEEISTRIKNKAGNRCERCNHPDEPETGYTLTTAHLDHNKANNEEWNLAALCQRCHLHFEHLQLETLFYQLELLEPFEQIWLLPHKEGFEAAQANNAS
jgi:hypothetical protein